jgi:superoxide reductase
MKALVCKVCGFVAINGTAPEKCPVCGAPKEAFQEKENALNVAKDKNNLTEAEKKHVPVIKVVEMCGLITGSCKDINVKIGEVEHPMLSNHYIVHIDFYIDKEFISRVILTPEKLNPAAAIHIKPRQGTVTVVALCSVHGAWINEAAL